MKLKSVLIKCLCVMQLLNLSVQRLSAQENIQSGYIITKTNDTIRGYIQNDNINQFTGCTFRTDKNMPAVNYKPNDILAYRLTDNGKFFISKEVPTEQGAKVQFLEYLIQGKASMYFMRDDMEHFYIQKEDGKLIELSERPVMLWSKEAGLYYKTPKYKGKLKYILSDCPEISSEIDRLRLYPENLIKLAKDYHEKVCNTEECIIFEKKIKPVHFKFDVLAGISYNDFRFNKENYTEKQLGSFVGGRVEVDNLFFSIKKLTLNAGLNLQYFSNHTFHTDAYIYNNVVYYENRISKLDMQAFTVKIPVKVNYYFTQTKWKPYISMGMTNMFFLTQNKNIYITDFTDYYGNAVPLYQFGYIVTAGLSHEFKNKESLFLELNFEYIQNENINESLRFLNHYYSITIGYQL